MTDACRLVVNVYKHGKGRSLDELALKYPEYLDHEFPKEAAPALAGAFLRRAPGGAVEAGQMLAQLRAVDEAVDGPKQVIGWDMVLEPELVEQAFLHHEALAHHDLILR